MVVRSVRAEQKGDVSDVGRLWLYCLSELNRHGDVSVVGRLWLYGPSSLNLSP